MYRWMARNERHLHRFVHVYLSSFRHCAWIGIRYFLRFCHLILLDKHNIFLGVFQFSVIIKKVQVVVDSPMSDPIKIAIIRCFPRFTRSFTENFFCPSFFQMSFVIKMRSLDGGLRVF